MSETQRLYFSQGRSGYMLIYNVLSVHGLDSRRTISMSYHVKTQNIMSIHFFNASPDTGAPGELVLVAEMIKHGSDPPTFQR